MQEFETQYGLTSEEFERRFNAGETEESLDFIERGSKIKTARLLDAQR